MVRTTGPRASTILTDYAEKAIAAGRASDMQTALRQALADPECVARCERAIVTEKAAEKANASGSLTPTTDTLTDTAKGILSRGEAVDWTDALRQAVALLSP